MTTTKPILCIDSSAGREWAAYRGDCVKILEQLPANCIDFSVYSPPFANLYIYSESEADMGNCADDEEFFAHYAFLVKELYRAMRPGRCVAVHCKDLVYYKNQEGSAGIRDFPGDLIRAHCHAGFDYHSRVTIWKDPVIEMQRTKAHGLLYKQLRADSTFSRQGLADYLLIFRKWAQEGEEISPVTHTPETFPLRQWQEWASPVWMTVQQTNVLNKEQARDGNDEKHICPLQLDVIERAVTMWSNRGDVVFSPFMGIGSEGVGSIKLGRKFVGAELKDTYFRDASRYLAQAESEAASLFELAQ